MPKGRLNNPSTERDGLWFTHTGETKTLPMTCTQEMFHQSKIATRELRLPPIRVTRQTGGRNCFPFSLHDNRYSLERAGECLDIGFGRKKVLNEKNQQSSKNFRVLYHEPLANPLNYLDGLTNYQVSYIGQQCTVPSLYRRFPKHHLEKSNCMKLEPAPYT